MSPEALVRPRADLFPGDGRFGVAVVLGQAALDLRPLRPGERQRLGLGGDAVLEVLGQLYALGDGQLQQLVERKVRHVPRLPAHRFRVNRDDPATLEVPRIGEETEITGEVREEPARMVLMHTGFGGTRMIGMLVGDPLPRIC